MKANRSGRVGSVESCLRLAAFGTSVEGCPSWEKQPDVAVHKATGRPGRWTGKLKRSREAQKNFLEHGVSLANISCLIHDSAWGAKGRATKMGRSRDFLTRLEEGRSFNLLLTVFAELKICPLDGL